MDIHDYPDVAENYDHYIESLAGKTSGGLSGGFETFHLDLAKRHGAEGILDIACGTGAALVPLILAGYRVTGIDISEAMLDVLRRKLAVLRFAVRQRAELAC